MSRTARSIVAYGIYAVVEGVILTVGPNFILVRLGISPATEVGIRIAGLLLFSLGTYYLLAARNEVTWFFKWTVYTRGSVVFIFAIFVLLGVEKPGLLILGFIDFFSAIWTGFELRAEGKL